MTVPTWGTGGPRIANSRGRAPISEMERDMSKEILFSSPGTLTIRRLVLGGLFDYKDKVKGEIVLTREKLYVGHIEFPLKKILTLKPGGLVSKHVKLLLVDSPSDKQYLLKPEGGIDGLIRAFSKAAQQTGRE